MLNQIDPIIHRRHHCRVLNYRIPKIIYNYFNNHPLSRNHRLIPSTYKYTFLIQIIEYNLFITQGQLFSQKKYIL